MMEVPKKLGVLLIGTILAFQTIGCGDTKPAANEERMQADTSVSVVGETRQDSETGGTLFSIQTAEKYPGDGSALIDYAAQEQDEDARPELTSHIENPGDYDIFFVGFAGGIIGLN